MIALHSLKDVFLSSDHVLRQQVNLYSFFIIFASFLLRFLFLGSHDLLVEEAYYWNYSQHLDFSYLDHPPMVALLIKISTIIFGTNEFAIRIPALLCWGLAAFFSFKWTELIHRGSGQYAILLLSIMPFYFFQSTITTPDLPVLVCWSAALYYFYRVFIFEESYSWYKAGVCLGLGMLSKYTIVLLGPAVLLYLISVPSARYWFFRKEPYLCVFVALLLFTPVIYWNVKHEWVSFIFQSTRRFNSPHSFHFHHFIGVILLFLLPGGVIGLCHLWSKKTIPIDIKTRRFIQIFTLFPLAFFGMHSLNHTIKLDWIGPGLISLIPWLAILISNSTKFYKAWHLYGVILLFFCTILIGVIAFWVPANIPEVFFRNLISQENITARLRGVQKLASWEHLTLQFHDIAKQVELTNNKVPIIVPMDVYNIGSELAFYQNKLVRKGKIQESYAIIGRHIFGKNSLMYRYWSDATVLSGKILILVSPYLRHFALPSVTTQTEVLSSPQELWVHSLGRKGPMVPYYYAIVKMK